MEKSALRSTPVGSKFQVQIFSLQKPVHEGEDLHNHLVLPEVIAPFVNDLIPPL